MTLTKYCERRYMRSTTNRHAAIWWHLRDRAEKHEADELYALMPRQIKDEPNRGIEWLKIIGFFFVLFCIVGILHTLGIY
jgi:hypothetical protein